MAHGSQRITTATASPREQHLRSAEKTARESDRAEGVELGAICAAVAWSGVYSLHALCVFYFIAAGKIYAFIPTTVVLAWEMDSYIRTVPTKYFNDIAIVHFVFAALHAAFLLQPLARRVCVRVLPRRLSSLAGLPPSQRHRLLSVRSLLRGSARGVLRCITVFSVQSEYFEVVFVLREILEVVRQSLQAYQMSIHIPRLLLNRVFVTLLVLNCWSTLVVHHVVNGKSEQRLLCLLADLLLDFVVSMGIPIVLSVTYIQKFDVKLRRFPYEFAYIDKWFVNYINEMPIIMLGSWTDAISRLIFSVSLLVGLNDIKTLIHHRSSNSVAPSASTATSTALTAPQRVSTSASAKKSAQAHRLVVWGHLFMAVYGLAILVIHLYAELGDPPNACVIPVRPWLTLDQGCALIEFNCHPSVPNRVSSSDATTMNRVLSILDAPSLAQLSVRHCQDVEIVSELQRFQNLLAMKLYNVTVVSWPSTAALHRDFHERLCIVYIVYTTFPNDELPPGLLSPSFPDQLLDVEFSFTRLRELPSNLHELWHKQMVLYFEFCGLDQFPSVLLDMQPLELFIGGNKFETLPVELFYIADFDLFAVGATPLTAFPASVDPERLKGPGRIRFERTNISELPSWMDEVFLADRKLYAGETPLCASITSEDPNFRWLSEVNCVQIRVPRYPFAVEIREDERWS
ncbi:hypothetical protein PINS_up006693 [Pythium insidiosum]|nr:hypothetical protein PINS_up006693 [Pythium insidiosum]